ncbi:hypothetical protein N7G274_004062 [Stereocaulon virgatum]|uniref:VOC domain-containing protein n=1 Tax=Stereocaulon virgatum TaxID=373712 RepID=A0ABR4AAU9_9LECA
MLAGIDYENLLSTMSPSANPTTTPPGPDQIQLVRIGHVYYTHKDFHRAHSFLQAFGLTEVKRLNAGQPNEKIYYRGYGTEPWLYCSSKGEHDEFGGAAFVVESRKDLETATRVVPNASKIYALADAPGGGECVTVRDPLDGFPVHLVYGQTQREMTEDYEERAFNFPNQKHRPVNQVQRFHKGPAKVHKLGHFGMCVTNFAESLAFWTKHFNFKPSDLLHTPDGRDITTFMHLDRGLAFVDHHCFFIFQCPKSHVHHSSFEVFDFDTQVIGHDWLTKQGYENCWGVGRHILGSQIFDYWFDTSRFILEHYVDGDLVNCETPINRDVASPNGLHIWGPDLPPTFMQ